jgi:hypothetical protein
MSRDLALSLAVLAIFIAGFLATYAAHLHGAT